jgi:ADP-heptose:LPS heptosyltransferase
MQPEFDIKRVLIYRIGSLGDTVVALPCFHLIERKFPNANRILVTNRPWRGRSAASASVLQNSGLIHDSWQMKIGVPSRMSFVQLLLRIRIYRPQVVVYLSERSRIDFPFRDNLFLRLAGVTRVYGRGSKRDLEPMTDLRTRTTEMEAVRLSRSLQALGDADPSDLANWDLRLTAAEKNSAAEKTRTLSGRPFVVCGPGSNRPSTDWGQKRWRDLLGALSSEHPNLGLATVGSGEDYSLSEFVSSLWSGPKLNLCGKLNVRETAAVIEQACLYVGPDSGPMHLAAAVETMCVVVCSARNLPIAWFPAGSRHKILYKHVSCRGCGFDICEEERLRCLTSIGVEEVLFEVTQALR